MDCKRNRAGWDPASRPGTPQGWPWSKRVHSALVEKSQTHSRPGLRGKSSISPGNVSLLALALLIAPALASGFLRSPQSAREADELKSAVSQGKAQGR